MIDHEQPSVFFKIPGKANSLLNIPEKAHRSWLLLIQLDFIEHLNKKKVY